MRELWIQTEKGLKLKAFVYNTCKSPTAIIICHGFTGNCSTIFLPRIAEKLSENYLVCRFDFRGQGQSEGSFYDTCITLELEDLHRIVEYISLNYHPLNIVLLAHSFGAAIAVLYTIKNNISGLISLSGEGNLHKAISFEFNDNQLRDFEERGETLVFNWAVRRKEPLNKRFLEDMKYYSTLDAAKCLRVPVFFIHGTSDKVIPHTATEEMYSIVKAPKTLKLLPQVGHTYEFLTTSSVIDGIILDIKSWLKTNGL